MVTFFDLETTGLDQSKDRIVQISLKTGNEELDLIVNPEMNIPEEVTKIHGITNEMVKDKPTFKEVAQEVLDFIGDNDLGGFNIKKFDIPFLIEELNRNGFDVQRS